MSLTREYRVVLPLSVEEFHRGREWHHAEKLKLDLKMLQDHQQQHGDCPCNNKFHEDVIVTEPVKAIPFFHDQTGMPNLPGEHSIKHYGQVPESVGVCSQVYQSFMSALDVFATNLIQVTEVESWDAFPYFCSISTNRYLGDAFVTIIEGRCVAGNCTEDNALNLPENILKKREVIVVDIAGDVDSEDYRDGKDPVIFKSSKTGRGPLKTNEWFDSVDPCMTLYVVVSIKCKLWGFGLSGVLERKLHKGVERAMLLHHRELYCLIDEWIDTSMEEIKATVEELSSDIKSYISSGDREANNSDTKKQRDENGNEGRRGPVNQDPNIVSPAVEESYVRKFTPMIAAFFVLIVALVLGLSPASE